MKKFTLLILLAFQFFQIAGNKLFNANNCYSQWVKVNNGMGNKNVFSITGSDNVLLAATISGVYRSTNYGESWIQILNCERPIYSIVMNYNYVFAGGCYDLQFYPDTICIWRSTNYGQSWTGVFGFKVIFSLIFNSSNIFAGSSWAGVYLSSNNGSNWLQTSLVDKSVQCLYSNENNIFAGCEFDKGVYFSANNGQSWSQIGLNGYNVYSLTSIGNKLFAGTYDVGDTSSGVWTTTNLGQTWSLTALHPQYVRSLITNGNNIFAGCSWGQGVFLSTNSGLSWVQKNQGLVGYNPNIYSLFILGNYIYAGTDSSVWRRSLSEIIGIKNISTEIPTSFSLEQNYPNPFNAITNIKFSLPKDENVKLTVFDLLGREVATVVNERLQAGTYSVDFDASYLTSGVYFYRITTGEFSDIKKMILIK